MKDIYKDLPQQLQQLTHLDLVSFKSNSNIDSTSTSIVSITLPPFIMIPSIEVKDTVTQLPENHLEITLNKEIPEEVDSIEELKRYTFPHFIIDNKTLHVPSKVEAVIRRAKIKKKLKEINKDPEVAIELCLILISNLSNTYFIGGESGWKKLNASILNRQVKVSENGGEYKKIIDLLSDETIWGKGPIIEVQRHYKVGTSRQYRLSDRFFRKGVTTYTLKQEKPLGLRKRSFYEAWAKAIDNVIPRNLIHMYGMIELPTKEEIIERAKEIIADKQKVGKGKLLKFVGKNRNRIDTKKFSIVEDCIQIFEHLTKDGYMVPGDSEAAGGRWADSFSLMPSWIRKMCTVDGQPIFENDYSCLHPNIAMSLYGGKQSFLTHQLVADDSGIDKDIVKIEHLSLFNKQWNSMMKSPLFKHYESTDPEMLANIYARKAQPYELNGNLKEGYKNVSLDLFRKETEIMTNVITKLNREGIYVIYVYDALYSSKKDSRRVAEVMNETVWEMGVMTSVDGSNPFKELIEVTEEVSKPSAPVIVKEEVKEINIDTMFESEFKPKPKLTEKEYIYKHFTDIQSLVKSRSNSSIEAIIYNNCFDKETFINEYKKYLKLEQEMLGI